MFTSRAPLCLRISFLPLTAPAHPSAISPFTPLLHERAVRRRTVSGALLHFTCLLRRQCCRQKGRSPLPRQLAADPPGRKLVSNNAAILTQFLSAFNRFCVLFRSPPAPTLLSSPLLTSPSTHSSPDACGFFLPLLVVPPVCLHTLAEEHFKALAHVSEMEINRFPPVFFFPSLPPLFRHHESQAE